jgi:hypothetical protein
LCSLVCSSYCSNPGYLKEHVHLEELARQVHVDNERAQVQTIPDNRRSVIVIERKPLLALRYILPNGQVRSEI